MKTIDQQFQLSNEFFKSGQTKSYHFRITQLEKLKQIILKNEDKILLALKEDLNKPETEAYTGEIGLLYSEIRYAQKKLKKWMKKKYTCSPIFSLPAISFVQPEPKGVVLIIGPWNYPFQLVIAPLIAAIAAGNCCFIKPSEMANSTSNLIYKIFHENFQENYINIVQGDLTISEKLLDLPFDHIFFTGSTVVGKIVMEKAAKNLTSVTLELGGKSPCILDENIPLKTTARRIIWGKFYNAGQTCIAPDYLLIPNKNWNSIVDAIIDEIKIIEKDPSSFAKIINHKHFTRLKNLAENEKVIYKSSIFENSSDKLPPTLIELSNLNSPILREEIFGPLLPLIRYNTLEEARTIIEKNDYPLSLYTFSKKVSFHQFFQNNIRFGGGCENDTLIHASNHHLPFGGIKSSGFGSYHGQYGFEAFSHLKPIIKRFFIFDLKLRYRPYNVKNFTLIKWLLRYF